MEYEVGQKVRIKSLDWYNENKDDNREIKFENGIFTTLKSTFLGQIMTIEEITLEKQYILMEDRYKTLWTDEMIEGLVEEGDLIPKFGEYSDNEPLDVPTMTTEFVKEHGFPCPNGYIFKDENGNVINATKIVLEKKKKEYPKTYEECCKVLNVAVSGLCILDNILDTTEIIYSKNLDRLLNSFRKLRICRDAYWKIAGEEMGLGKPWEPRWNDNYQKKWIINFYQDEINLTNGPNVHFVLAFPTAEMRDAFYENFKELIEQCKELL